MSKLIQKEKERQEQILVCKDNGCVCITKKHFHKQSLINLKEHLEGELKGWSAYMPYLMEKEFERNIKELKEMIIKYG